MQETGNRIRKLRIDKNMTLDDVARHLGVGRQAIYKYEQGTVTNIPLENIEKMAQLFDVTPCYLAGWSMDESDNRHDSPFLFTNEDECQLLDQYRALNVKGKQYVRQQLQIAQVMFGEKSSSFPDAEMTGGPR